MNKSYPIEVTVVSLSPEEEKERLFLERKVERAFYEAGNALKQLRDQRLYRSTHRTFEEYCYERFAFQRRHPYQLINAAEVVDNLMTFIETEKMCANGAQILPTSERQVRPLTSLEPDEQREAWNEAITEAGGKLPSGRIVKDIVQRIKERTSKSMPNPFTVGDVVRIQVKDDPDLKGNNNVTAIVTEIHEFSCTVQTYQGKLTIRIANLKPLDFDSKDSSKIATIINRLSRIYHEDLEETAMILLNSLGKINRAYLTKLEENLIQFLENEDN